MSRVSVRVGVMTVRAYACATCGTVYTFDAHGKKRARTCCLCTKCGGISDQTDTLGLCAACKREDEWKRACRRLKDALIVYQVITKAQNSREPELEALLAEHVNDDRAKLAKAAKKPPTLGTLWDTHPQHRDAIGDLVEKYDPDGRVTHPWAKIDKRVIVYFDAVGTFFYVDRETDESFVWMDGKWEAA